jgi:hypothetical protein
MAKSSKKNKPRFLATTLLPSIIQQNSVSGGHSKSIEPLETTIEKTNTDGLFTCFPNLPAEIRLKIWGKANDIGLIIDLWTEYRKCEVANAGLYHQHYGSKLTDTYSRVRVNRESRDEVGSPQSFSEVERLLTKKVSQLSTP